VFNSSFFLFLFGPKSGRYYYGLRERKEAFTAFDLQPAQPCKRSAARKRTHNAQQIGFTAAFRVLARWAILKIMENFSGRMTGEEGKTEKDMDTNTEKNKERK